MSQSTVLLRITPWVVVFLGALPSSCSLPTTVLGPDAGRSIVLNLNAHDAPASLSPDDHGCQISISPDGAWTVYPASDQRLMIRDMHTGSSRVLVEHWGVRDAFFSPDGETVAYFTGNQLRREPVAGGRVQTLIEELPGHAKGACWTGAGIVFSPASNAGLWRIPASGGVPVQLTTPDAQRGERSHRWPSALPDGRGLIFTIKTRDIVNFDDAKIAVLDLSTRSWRVLIDGGSCARYAPSGHLVWARAGKLFAAPFDLGTMTVNEEEARVVVDGVRTQNESGAAMYSFSGNGSLVYMAGSATEPRQELVWVDRTNHISKAFAEPRAFIGEMAMSPDGKLVAIPGAGANDTIWIFDVETDEMRRLTHDGNCGSPAWTSNSAELMFLSDRDGQAKVFAKQVDGKSPARRVFGSPTLLDNYGHRLALSPDDKWLALTRRGDIVLVDIKGGAKPRDLAATPRVEEMRPSFSPDGKHVAYVSDAGGTRDIYVRPAVGDASPALVARAGGANHTAQPHWSADGTKLYYLAAESIFEVSVQTGDSVVAGRPQQVALVENATGFCVHPDGNRFLVCRRLPQQSTWDVRVVVNWFADLR